MILTSHSDSGMTDFKTIAAPPFCSSILQQGRGQEDPLTMEKRVLGVLCKATTPAAPCFLGSGSYDFTASLQHPWGTAACGATRCWRSNEEQRNIGTERKKGFFCPLRYDLCSVSRRCAVVIPTCVFTEQGPSEHNVAHRAHSADGACSSCSHPVICSPFFLFFCDDGSRDSCFSSVCIWTHSVMAFSRKDISERRREASLYFRQDLPSQSLLIRFTR